MVAKTLGYVVARKGEPQQMDRRGVFRGKADAFTLFATHEDAEVAIQRTVEFYGTPVPPFTTGSFAIIPVR